MFTARIKIMYDCAKFYFTDHSVYVCRCFKAGTLLIIISV